MNRSKTDFDWADPFCLCDLRTADKRTVRDAPRPLAGVRVLDLSRVRPCPWASQIVADYEADVIKVERPGSGDTPGAGAVKTGNWPNTDGLRAVNPWLFYCSINGYGKSRSLAHKAGYDFASSNAS